MSWSLADEDFYNNALWELKPRRLVKLDFPTPVPVKFLSKRTLGWSGKGMGKCLIRSLKIPLSLEKAATLLEIENDFWGTDLRWSAARVESNLKAVDSEHVYEAYAVMDASKTCRPTLFILSDEMKRGRGENFALEHLRMKNRAKSWKKWNCKSCTLVIGEAFVCTGYVSVRAHVEQIELV